MKTDSAHQRPWVIAEVVFGAPFLLGTGLGLICPLPALPASLSPALIAAGILSAGAGIGFILLGRRELRRFRQPTDPGLPTSQLVKTGVFAISRNPLYLGAALLFLGLALGLYLPWTLLTLGLAVVICQVVLILPEERYLAAKFGTEYTDYTAAVRRWLGRKFPAGR